MTLEESMSNNLLRIHSFNNFPREVNIFTSFLARAGFYYTGVSDVSKLLDMDSSNVIVLPEDKLSK
jgi:hypothetical protein